MSTKLSTKEIKVFNKNILLKTYSCTEDKDNPIKSEPRLKLNIKITDSCDCSCPFCSNRNIRDFGKLDLKKLEEVIRELNKTGILNRISITGGEPMLYPDILNKVVNLILSINSNIIIGVTTNGLNLKKFLDFDNVEKIESIHISRHHYDDKINKSIFNSDAIATSDDIKYLQSKLKDKLIININTVLSKGFIDNYDELKKMFEYVNSLGVRRIGLISLLRLNDYAKEHFIDFNDIMKDRDHSIIITNHLRNYDYCNCINGLYSTNDGNMIEYYARMVEEKDCPYVTALVYTSDNKLKTGFSGEVIY